METPAYMGTSALRGYNDNNDNNRIGSLYLQIEMF